MTCHLSSAHRFKLGPVTEPDETKAYGKLASRVLVHAEKELSPVTSCQVSNYYLMIFLCSQIEETMHVVTRENSPCCDCDLEL